MNMKCYVNSTVYNLDFQIADKPAASPLGLKDSLKIDLIKLHEQVHEINSSDDFRREVLIKYKDLFDDHLGKLPVVYVMKVDSSVTPVIKPPRKIPVALEKTVKKEFDRMVQEGAITPVSEPSDGVSQVIATKKKNGEIRICLDPRHLNQALKRSHHPMKSVESVTARMVGATVFSTLDARSGFWQIQLEEKTSFLTTFSTRFGRYRYLRMPFGISTASKVYQQTMELLFAGYPCEIIIDDIWFGGVTWQNMIWI